MEEPAVISYNPKQKAELGEIDVKIAKQEASINTIMSNEKIPLANREALVSKIRLGIEQLQTRRDEIRKQARAISIAIARKQKLEGSSSSNQVDGVNSAALASGSTPTKTISQDTVLTPKQSSRAIGRGKPVERPVMKLDNRPKSLVITNAPDEFKDTTVLFNYFKVLFFLPLPIFIPRFSFSFFVMPHTLSQWFINVDSVKVRIHLRQRRFSVMMKPHS